MAMPLAPSFGCSWANANGPDIPMTTATAAPVRVKFWLCMSVPPLRCHLGHLCYDKGNHVSLEPIMKSIAIAICCLTMFATPMFGQGDVKEVTHPYFPLKVGTTWTYRWTARGGK